MLFRSTNAKRLLLKTFLIISLSTLMADENHPVNITKDIPYIDVDIDGKIVRIERIQDTNHKLKNSYAKTSRVAPPFSVQPVLPVDGITGVGELEIIDFLSKQVTNQTGVLIDARMPKWYKEGTIPGAVNIPFTIIESSAYKNILQAIGVKGDDFSNAQEILVFDNGPWCQQGSHFIKSIIKHGYPKSKIKYYRGGMQFWQILGLTTLKDGRKI